MRSVLFLSMVMLLSSCASLHSVSLTSVPKDRSHPVKAEGFSWGIFGIYFSNTFVDEATEDLKKSCSSGKLKGVFTTYEGRNYFLWATRTVKVQAFCDKGDRS